MYGLAEYAFSFKYFHQKARDYLAVRNGRTACASSQTLYWWIDRQLKGFEKWFKRLYFSWICIPDAIKLRQSPDMTIAIGRDVKHQFK